MIENSQVAGVRTFSKTKRGRTVLISIGAYLVLVLLARWWYTSPVRIRWLVEGQMKSSPSHSLSLEWPSYWSDIALRNLGRRAVPTLIQLLNAKEERMRQQAARNLGRLADDRAIEPLCEVLEQDAEWLPREAAAGALGKIGHSRALPCLLRHLRDPRPRVVAACVSALGEIGHPDATLPLVTLLSTSGDDKVRAFVAQALGRIGDVRALPALRQVREDPSSDVAECASWGLAKMGDGSGLSKVIKCVERDFNLPPTRPRLEMIRVLAGFPGTVTENVLRKIAAEDVYLEARTAAAETLEASRAEHGERGQGERGLH